jgi:hypothetical protein
MVAHKLDRSTIPSNPRPLSGYTYRLEQLAKATKIGKTQNTGNLTWRTWQSIANLPLKHGDVQLLRKLW